MYDYIEVSELVGKTFINVAASELEIFFEVSGEERYRLFHHQDCCECVSIEDISGDLEDLIGSPIIRFEESTNAYPPLFTPYRDYTPDSETWTFYRIQTAKGLVVIRWYGESNGYYSESVSLERI